MKMIRHDHNSFNTIWISFFAMFKCLPECIDVLHKIWFSSVGYEGEVVAVARFKYSSVIHRNIIMKPMKNPWKCVKLSYFYLLVGVVINDYDLRGWLCIFIVLQCLRRSYSLNTTLTCGCDINGCMVLKFDYMPCFVS